MTKRDMPQPPILPFENPDRGKKSSDAPPSVPERIQNNPDEKKETREAIRMAAIEQQGAYAEKFKDIIDDLDAPWAEYYMGFGSLTNFPPFSQKTALMIFTGLVSRQKTHFLCRAKMRDDRPVAYIEKATGSGLHHGEKINVDAITKCAQAIFDRIVDGGAPLGDFSSTTPGTNPSGWIGNYYDNGD